METLIVVLVLFLIAIVLSFLFGAYGSLIEIPESITGKKYKNQQIAFFLTVEHTGSTITGVSYLADQNLEVNEVREFLNCLESDFWVKYSDDIEHLFPNINWFNTNINFTQLIMVYNELNKRGMSYCAELLEIHIFLTLQQCNFFDRRKALNVLKNEFNYYVPSRNRVDYVFDTFWQE